MNEIENPFDLEDAVADFNETLEQELREEAEAQVEDPDAKAALEHEQVEYLPLLRYSDLQQLPEPEWLIPNKIHTNSFLVLAGPYGSGKTFEALDWALHVVTNTPHNGQPVKSGKVVYMLAEGLNFVQFRIQAWLLKHPEADPDAVERNLFVVPRPVLLLEEKDRNLLLNTVKKARNLQMVLVDTWARALTGGDENSSKEAGIAVAVLDQVKRETQATVVVVHHTGKDGSIRGANALPSAADSVIQVEKDEASGVVTIKHSKTKDGVTPDTKKYTFVPSGKSVVLEEQVQNAWHRDTYVGPLGQADEDDPWSSN